MVVPLPPTVSSGTPTDKHHLKQTLFGPVCTKCNIKVNNSRLFDCCPNTITAHWKKNACIVGKSSARGVAKELSDSLSLFHTALIGKDLEAASKCFGAGSPATRSKRQRDYCSNCGLVQKKSKLLKQHCAPAEGETGGGRCPGNPAKGYVWTNVYNQCVPESFLHDIVSGRSPLQRLKPEMFSPPPPAAIQQQQQQQPSAPMIPPSEPQQIISPQTAATAATLPSSTTHHNQSSIPPHQHPALEWKRIKLDPKILTIINSPDYEPRIQKHARVMSLIAELNQDNANEHYAFFLHICLRSRSSNLKQSLLEMVPKYMLPVHMANEPRLKLLLRAAELTFTSDLSNMNVSLLDEDLRRALHRIAINVDFDDEDILRENIFGPTNNLEPLLKEIKYLLCFLFRSGAIDDDTLMGIDEIVYGGEDLDGDPNSDQVLYTNASKIVDVNILPVILLNPILDCNKIYHDYVAARSVNLCHQDGSIIIREPNDISCSSNALLRVIRHAVCDHLIFLLQQHERDGMPNPRERWRKKAWEIIGEIQQAAAPGHICDRIRSARYLGNKKASALQR